MIAAKIAGSGLATWALAAGLGYISFKLLNAGRYQLSLAYAIATQR